MNTINVSIIMPTFNSSRWVTDSIQSVLEQSYKKWELIIIDDGSTDNTLDVINHFLLDKRITLTIQANLGPAEARNHGISKAVGKYLAFLDSDDLWNPNKLELQLRYLASKEECDMVHTNYNYFYENLSNSKPFKQTEWFSHWPEKERLLICDNIGTLTVLVKKNIVENLGGFNKEFIGTEDWDLWIRISKTSIIHKMNDDTARYRIHTTGISQSHMKHFIELEKVYNQNVFIFDVPKKIQCAAKTVLSLRKSKYYFLEKKYFLFFKNCFVGINEWCKAYLYHLYISI